MIYRLRLEGSFHSLVLWLQCEGGYDLLSLPHPITLIRIQKLMNHDPTESMELLINTCTTLHNLHHTTQPLPLLTSAHQLVIVHYPLYHTAHQHIQSNSPINLYQSIYFSHHLTQSTWVKSTAYTTQQV